METKLFLTILKRQVHEVKTILKHNHLLYFSLLGFLIIFDHLESHFLSRTITSHLLFAWTSMVPLILTKEYWCDYKPLRNGYGFFVLTLIFFGMYLIAFFWQNASHPYVPIHSFLLLTIIGILSPKEIWESDQKMLSWILKWCQGIVQSIFTLGLIYILLFGGNQILKLLLGVIIPDLLITIAEALMGSFIVIIALKHFLPKKKNPTDIEYTFPIIATKTELWILFLSCFTYLLLLIAYSLKILIAWRLPIGWVSLPISIAYCMIVIIEIIRQINISSFSSQFSKALRILRWCFIPLWVLMCIAIYVRISSYGLTESRFFLVLGFVFLLLIWFNTLKNQGIKIRIVVLFSLIYLLVFMWKPLQPVEILRYSQLLRQLERSPNLGKNLQSDAEVDYSHWGRRDFDSFKTSLAYLNRPQPKPCEKLELQKNTFAQPFSFKNEEFLLDIELLEKAPSTEPTPPINGLPFYRFFIDKSDYTLKLNINQKISTILDFKSLVDERNQNKNKGAEVLILKPEGRFHFILNEISINCFSNPLDVKGFLFFKLTPSQ